MVLTDLQIAVPLRHHPDGIIYVGQTRVPLETVIETYQTGVSAEEIVMQYPALALGDVYWVIGYYLNHRAEVESYLVEARTHAAEVRRVNEARWDTSDLRERLLARN